MIWKEKYKIGIQTIDDQHEELFRRVSDFIEALREDRPWSNKLPKVQETMEFMQNYVVTHFNYEENYQKSIHYPEHEAHQKIHEDFKNEVNHFVKKFTQEGYSEEGVQQLAGKLMAWLINHVVATDLKMAEYVKGQESEKK